MSGWTIKSRIEAEEAVIKAYEDMVDRSFKFRHIDQNGHTRKYVRAAYDVDVEQLRYARGCLAAFKSGGDDIEVCWEAEHKFSREFEWKADKRWRRYFG